MELLRKLGYDELANTWGQTSREGFVTKRVDQAFISASFDLIEDMYARVCSDVKLNWRPYPKVIIGEQAGAALAFELALGWKPDQILEQYMLGTFNPWELITGGRKLKGVLATFHPTKNGAQHKGHRFRDAIDSILRTKYEIDGRMTMREFHQRTGVTFGVLVNELNTKTDMLITHVNFPDMFVSDVVLAGVAVPTFVMRVQNFTEVDGVKIERRFVSTPMNGKITVPLLQRLRGQFVTYVQNPLGEGSHAIVEDSMKIANKAKEIAAKTEASASKVEH